MWTDCVGVRFLVHDHLGSRHPAADTCYHQQKTTTAEWCRGNNWLFCYLSNTSLYTTRSWLSIAVHYGGVASVEQMEQLLLRYLKTNFFKYGLCGERALSEHYVCSQNLFRFMSCQKSIRSPNRLRDTTPPNFCHST